MAAGAPAPIVAAVTTAEFAVLIAGLIILDALSDGIPDIRDEARFGACQERKARAALPKSIYKESSNPTLEGVDHNLIMGKEADTIKARTISLTPRDIMALITFCVMKLVYLLEPNGINIKERIDIM